MVADQLYLWEENDGFCDLSMLNWENDGSCDLSINQVDEEIYATIIRGFYPVEPTTNDDEISDCTMDEKEERENEDQLIELFSFDDIDGNIQNSSDASSYEMTFTKSTSSDLAKLPKERKKSTRKPSFRPKYMKGLRVLRSDIRRTYPEMYTNVMNSLDGKLFSQFFQKFCSNNIIYECGKKEQCEIGKFAAALVPKPVVGISSLIPFMVTFFTPTIFADMVVRLKSSKVIVTQGVPGSRIVAQDHTEMTLLYSVERIPYPEYQSLPSPSSPSPSFDILDPVSNDLIRFSLLPTPIRVKLEIDLVLTLDESHLINGIYRTQRNSVIMPFDA